MNTTYMPNPSKVERKWYVVDAEGQTLGRLASEVAKVLRGKNKPIYTPHEDCGDYVIVVNAEKISVTGKKMEEKTYFRHSDYVGGVRTMPLSEKLAWHRDNSLTVLLSSSLDQPCFSVSSYLQTGNSESEISRSSYHTHT